MKLCIQYRCPKRRKCLRDTAENEYEPGETYIAPQYDDSGCVKFIPVDPDPVRE